MMVFKLYKFSDVDINKKFVENIQCTCLLRLFDKYNIISCRLNNIMMGMKDVVSISFQGDTKHITFLILNNQFIKKY